eukprot:gene14208-biopygen13428
MATGCSSPRQSDRSQCPNRSNWLDSFGCPCRRPHPPARGEAEREGAAPGLDWRQQGADMLASAVDTMDDFEQLANEHGRNQEQEQCTPQGPTIPDDAGLDAMVYSDLVILASQCGLRVPDLRDAASARKALQLHTVKMLLVLGKRRQLAMVAERNHSRAGFVWTGDAARGATGAGPPAGEPGGPHLSGFGPHQLVL